jgi:hypothetical protein
MLPDELASHLRAHGVQVRDAEARRVLAHAVAHGRAGFPVSRPVPRAVEDAVDALTDRAPLEILERATDPSDGFVKVLFRLHDGALAEAVRIPSAKAASPSASRRRPGARWAARSARPDGSA